MGPVSGRDSAIRATIQLSTSLSIQATERGPKWIGFGKVPSAMRWYNVDLANPVRASTCRRRRRVCTACVAFILFFLRYRRHSLLLGRGVEIIARGLADMLINLATAPARYRPAPRRLHRRRHHPPSPPMIPDQANGWRQRSMQSTWNKGP
jgi:hypothetical protein